MQTKPPLAHHSPPARRTSPASAGILVRTVVREPDPQATLAHFHFLWIWLGGRSLPDANPLQGIKRMSGSWESSWAAENSRGRAPRATGWAGQRLPGAAAQALGGHLHLPRATGDVAAIFLFSTHFGNRRPNAQLIIYLFHEGLPRLTLPCSEGSCLLTSLSVYALILKHCYYSLAYIFTHFFQR